MKTSFTLIFGLLITLNSFSQATYKTSSIRDMQWDSASNIILTLNNNQKYSVKIEDILHSRTNSADSTSRKFVYYPVMLASDFVNKIQQTQIREDKDAMNADTSSAKPMITLWGTLHGSLGGGWIHFVNCLLLSLETRSLSLTAPLMVRSQWKPSHPTATWKRTKHWKYYVPVEQKMAKKEYYIKKKENRLDNLQDVPSEFIDLFLNTSDREYKRMVKNNDYKKLARIDLVKLLLGANYLGRPQITYVKNLVQKTIMQYAQNQLPTIIIFDDLNAAVVMSLDETGYKIEKTIFRNQTQMTNSDRQTKELKIEISIESINKANQKIFEDRLKNMYK